MYLKGLPLSETAPFLVRDNKASKSRNKKFIKFHAKFCLGGLQNKNFMLLYTSLALRCFEC